MKTTAAPQSSMFPRIIYAYMAVFQLVLIGLSLFLYPSDTFDLHLGDQLVQVLLVAAVATFALGFVVPRLILGKIKVPGAGASHPLGAIILPFMIRLCLFEFCALLGFVGSVLTQNGFVIVPFSVLGFLGTALSAPTDAFYDRLRNG